MAKVETKRKKMPSPVRAEGGVSKGNAPVKRRGTPPKSEGGRTPFILRFDSEVYVAIKELAEQTGVSVNQLMEGFSRWAIRNVRAGEPVVNDIGEIVGERAERGCVWAGETPNTVREGSVGKARGVWMFLDFTNRRVVREDV